MNILKKPIKHVLKYLGIKISYTDQPDPIIESDQIFLEIYNKCKDQTMTSKSRMFSLYKSVIYIVKSELPGDLVECGVWKGGSAMLIAYTLLSLGIKNKKIVMYDTYEGMSEPTDIDRSAIDKKISTYKFWQNSNMGAHNEWCFASLEEVKENLFSTGYPKENLIFIKGKVEDTIPVNSPATVSLLRLDTDWYESTRHELIHLYPKLIQQGVLIVDDYGYWEGSKRAVDEYFENKAILFNKIDHTGIVGIKSFT